MNGLEGVIPSRTVQRPGILERAARSRGGTATAIAGLAGLSALVPVASPLALLAGASLFRRRRAELRRFPLRVPAHLGLADPGDPDPRTGRPKLGRGIAYMGRAARDGGEVWLSGADLRRHLLVLGPTGHGRRGVLTGLAANALAWGGGFTFVDAMGDLSLLHHVHALCERFGRLGDLRVLNLLDREGGARGASEGGGWEGDTFDPFRSISAGSAAALLIDLFPVETDTPGLWRGRAYAMISAVMACLCWLRDHEGLPLDARVVFDHLSLPRTVALAEDERIPEDTRSGLRMYLGGLPGFVREKGDRQAQTTIDQHGYLGMAFLRALHDMTRRYAHVFCACTSTIDMADVIANRRILVVLLPGLERRSNEVVDLAGIVLSSFRAAMSAPPSPGVARFRGEGSSEDAPCMLLCDGAGHCMTGGTGLLAVQARAYGVGLAFADADIPSLGRQDERGAAIVTANTDTKVFLHDAEGHAGSEASLLSRGVVTRFTPFDGGAGIEEGGSLARPVFLPLPTTSRRTRT